MPPQLLSRRIKPTHYALSLYDLCLEAPFSYQGRVCIRLDVQEPTDTIWLNAKELEIQEASLTFTGQPASIALLETDYDERLERVMLQFSAPISGPEAQLEIVFRGIINNSLTGFYRTSARVQHAAREDRHWVYSTQFESCHARKAFPCFDEPGLKATFDLQVQVPQHLTVLSNMPEKTVRKVDDVTHVVSFERTPLMSTYLLAWAIGVFEHIEGLTERKHDGRRVPLRAYTTQGLASSAQYALEHSCRVLDWFAEIFGMDYPLPKLDLVCIPEYAMGAMENWGLCTFEALTMLYDEATSALDNKERASYVIAHEIAHQWFGNLVTMEWWNDLWLKEGFATWAGWEAVNHFHPEWNVWQKFYCERLQTAFQLDSLQASHPIDVDVKNGPDIDEVYDDISYLKGSSVVRMLDSFLGRETFLAGIQTYLKKFAYSNAQSSDLWYHLSKANGKEVDTFMDGWIRRKGYPVLSVEVASHCVTFSQRRFLPSSGPADTQDEAVWRIPIHLPNGEQTQTVVFDTQSTQVELSSEWPSLASVASLANLNWRQTGFYITNYSSEILRELISHRESLDLGQKLALIADTSYLQLAGQRSVVDLLELISGFQDEQDYYVWLQISRALNTINSLLAGSESNARGLQNFQLRLLENIINDVDWEVGKSEDYMKTKIRSLLLRMAGAAGHQRTVERALQLFHDHVNGNASLDRSLVHPVLSTVATHGGLDGYQKLKSIYLTAPTASIDLKETCICAMGASSSSPAAVDLFAFLLSTDMQVADLPTVAESIAANPRTRNKFWKWLKINLEALTRKCDGSLQVLDRFLRAALSGFAEDDMEQGVRTFFAGKDCESLGFSRGIEVVVERLSVNARYRKSQESVLQLWLERKGFV